MQLKYVQLDVFTTTRFLGNPLAIVHIPADVTLVQSQKQLIAREFNLSETVFLHDQDTSKPTQSVVVIDIFTPTEELPFAGHPTVGTGWYLLQQRSLQSISEASALTLRTKAGDIPVLKSSASPGKVQVRVPLNFKVHRDFAHPAVKTKDLQPALDEKDYFNGRTGPEAVVSVVKGMTFYLLELTSEKALEGMRPFPTSLELPEGYLGEWEGFVGLYAFFEREDGVVRSRMFEGLLEDPATGSAASAFAGWLALRRLTKNSAEGNRTKTLVIEVVQGVEMGRRSEISVSVSVEEKLGGELQVVGVDLQGGAISVLNGFVEVDV